MEHGGDLDDDDLFRAELQTKSEEVLVSIVEHDVHGSPGGGIAAFGSDGASSSSRAGRRRGSGV